MGIFWSLSCGASVSLITLGYFDVTTSGSVYYAYVCIVLEYTLGDFQVLDLRDSNAEVTSPPVHYPNTW